MAPPSHSPGQHSGGSLDTGRPGPKGLDLRYFGNAAPLSRDLARYGAVWVRGGNVFVLRYALYRAGGETILAEALHRDALVYAGYSAGPCVLAASPRGLEAVDERALARACQYPYTAHCLLPSVPPGATTRPARPGMIMPDLATATRHRYHGPLTS